MGTWGTGIFDDDMALDVSQLFGEAVQEGSGPLEAADRVLGEVAEALGDPDDGPVILVSLASLLIDRGMRDHAALAQARRVIESGAGLERWQEAGEEALAGRRTVLEELLARIS